MGIGWVRWPHVQQYIMSLHFSVLYRTFQLYLLVGPDCVPDLGYESVQFRRLCDHGGGVITASVFHECPVCPRSHLPCPKPFSGLFVVEFFPPYFKSSTIKLALDYSTLATTSWASWSVWWSLVIAWFLSQARQWELRLGSYHFVQVVCKYNNGSFCLHCGYTWGTPRGAPNYKRWIFADTGNWKAAWGVIMWI